MPEHAAAPEAIEGIRAAVPHLTITTDATLVRRRSRDRSHLLGPLMADEVGGALADAVAAPTTEQEVVDLLAACATHRVPVVPRGAGTSTFGQSIPLRGGIVLDLSGLTGVLHVDAERVRVRAGTLLTDIDDAAAAHGKELRIHPSSKRMSTAAGFVIGGHGGVGSIRHGGLADLGNVLGLRVLTAEVEPRTIELRGDRTNLVQFSFGMAGVVTEVELPLTDAYPWRDLVLTFPTLGDAIRYGHDLTLADGLDVKNCMVADAALSSVLTPLEPWLPAGRAASLTMAAPAAVEGVTDLARAHGGAVTYDVSVGEGPKGFPGYEYTWGHATWWLGKRHQIAQVLLFLPEQDPAATLDRLLEHVEGPRWVWSTCQRMGGRPAPEVGLSVDGAHPEQIAVLGDVATDLGCKVLSVHKSQLTESSMKGWDAHQRAFAADVDPHGILNPGHLADA